MFTQLYNTFTIFSNNQTTNVTQLYNFTKPYKTLQNFVQLYTTLHNSTILRTTSQLFSQLEQTFTKLSITIHSFTISTKKTMHNSTKHFKIHTHVQDLSTFSQYSTNISTRFNTFQNFQHYLQLYTTLHHFAKLSFVQKRLYIILQTLYTILQSSTQLKHKNSTQFYNTLQISTALYKV